MRWLPILSTFLLLMACTAEPPKEPPFDDAEAPHHSDERPGVGKLPPRSASHGPNVEEQADRSTRRSKAKNPSATESIDVQTDEPSEPETMSAIDELRSIPYLSFSEQKATEGTDGVMVWDKERAWPGLNLYTIRPLCTAKLIDMDGTVVRAWRHRPCERWARAELLPSGDLLVVGRETFENRVLLRFNWDGDLLARFELPVHHDVEITPEGKILVLMMNQRIEDLGHGKDRVRDDRLVLLQDNGSEIDSLSLFDALVPAGVTQEVQTMQDGAIDMFHANSIQWMTHAALFGRDEIYDARHVLVSMRHQDLIAIVNWDTKKLVWSWGQGAISGQHDATLLANGHILLFDNGVGRGWSRALEIDPITREIVWEFRGANDQTFFSRALGSAQRLPNGNTLIANSESGQAFEVTPDGETAWDYYTPQKNRTGHRASIVRMKRYAPRWIEPMRSE